MAKWYHDKKAGLVREEGREGYICRGFREEHGDLLAAGPELAEACKLLIDELGGKAAIKGFLNSRGTVRALAIGRDALSKARGTPF